MFQVPVTLWYHILDKSRKEALHEDALLRLLRHPWPCGPCAQQGITSKS